MKDFWIKQDSECIMNVCSGSTLLIRLIDSTNGITSDDGKTVDISWMRTTKSGLIHATTGSYTKDDISEYQIIK